MKNMSLREIKKQEKSLMKGKLCKRKIDSIGINFKKKIIIEPQKEKSQKKQKKKKN